MTETLNGFIERVTYHNPENGFAVLRVKVKGREDLVTLTGKYDLGNGGGTCRGQWSLGDRPTVWAAVQSR